MYNIKIKKMKTLGMPRFFLGILSLMGLLLYASTALAQSKTSVISGIVVDSEKEPLIGATVVPDGKSSQGVTTGIDGSFTLNVTLPTTLNISYIGFKNKVVPVKKVSDKLFIILEEGYKQLNEVVVIGYGVNKKQDLTGAVTSVKMADVESAPVLSIDQAMQGRIAGADIMVSTGEPGASSSIRIRGSRSVTASNEPLIVVDGVLDAVSDLNDLNPADIGSISVLKDASSTAIYGARGANGVIIITTKKGDYNNGKPNVTLKTEVGFSQLPRNLDLMNAAEYSQYRNDFYWGEEEYLESTVSNYKYSDPLSAGKGTDWIEAITRTAIIQNYNLSLSNSNQKSSYYASVGYNNTEGIIMNSGVERITGRFNADYQLFNKLKVGYQASLTWRNQDQNKASLGGTSASTAAVYLSPRIKVTDYTNEDYAEGTLINSPYTTALLNTKIQQRLSVIQMLWGELEIIKGLKLRLQGSYYPFQVHQYSYNPSILPKSQKEGIGGQAGRSEIDSYALSTENTLNYKFKLKKYHNFDLLAGITAYSYKDNTLNASGSGYVDDKLKWNNLAGVQDKNTYSVSTSSSEKKKMSYLGRMNYNYKSRYYFTFTGRFDGASNFAANKKWGFFPSGALKWNVSKEEFLKKVDWIDELAFRLSAGRTGNDAIGTYQSLEAMTTTSGGYLFNGSQPAAYYRTRVDNPDLTWEKTDQYNLGVDLSLFKGRLNVTAEVYYAKTSDLLLNVQLANQSGYNSRLMNMGKTSNKGVELSIESHNISLPKFSWSTTFTIASNKQKVEDLAGAEYISFYNSPDGYMMQGAREGYPLNALWGFQYAGVWHSTEEMERNDVTHTYASTLAITGSSGESRFGYPKYYDVNHDGALDINDMVYLGNADPDVYGGLQNTFKWGNLKVGVYFSYQLGGKIYNFSELYMSGSNKTNQYAYMVNAYHPVRNPNSDLPRAGTYATRGLPSSLMVHDASYLRLKTVSVSYTFNMKKTGILRDITLSAAGDNLWLWKDYNGFDPDVSTESGVARRIDMGAYPKARTITFSAQIRY